MLFFDYDGVIGNTEIGLFDEYKRLKEKQPDLTKIHYLIDFDWHGWLRKSGPKNDAFVILRAHNPQKASILTRCWSVNEAKEKILYIRENKVKNSIIIVPYDLPKSTIVDAEGNILVEDQICNVVEWQNARGIGLLFSELPVEGWKTISSIEEAFEYARKKEL